MTIANVVDGQLIDTPWGNAVADQINAHIIAIAKLPVGLVAHQQSLTNFVTASPHNTYQDEGLTVTITEAAHRRLRITLVVNPFSSVAGNAIAYQVLRNGVRVREWQFSGQAISNASASSFTLLHVITDSGVGASGVVYKVQIRNVTANSTVASFADAALPKFLMIDDLGAV